jgi:flagellar biosynthesis/type III secretory pathway chaperone
MDINWEAELAGLLNDLSSAQRELLELLAEKRKLLAAADTKGMAALQAREQAMLARLQACQEKRAELLATAQAQGLPSDSIRELATTLPRSSADSFGREIKEVAARSRLLQHQALTNWFLTQRTLIHLSQLLEIIATGGRPQPTYGERDQVLGSGSLVDQAA